MKAVLVTLSSFALTAGVIFNAFYQKNQFYPSVVYLTKSNPSMAVLYAQAFVFVVLFGKLLKKIFFGQLRAAEVEHLIEKSWYAVTETCLAFTVFRDDFSPKFVAMFTLLLFLKGFHWLSEDRIDYMERSPAISLVFHIRAIAFIILLSCLDLFLINHAYQSILLKGASVQLVFGFEYAILLTVTATVLMKYVLHAIDLQSENPWENKAVYLLYGELVLGFIKVILYLLFFSIMIKVLTFPLFAIRPLYLTMRSFKKSLNDVIKSRRAIRNMNTLYPNATEEELQATDNVCIICREEMVVGSCKKLPCRHIFHTSCLRSWFQRQQSCPICRLDVLQSDNTQQNRVQTPTPPPRPQAPPQGPAPQPAPGPAQMPNFWGVPPPQQPPRPSTQTTTQSSGSTTTTPTTASTSNASNMPGPRMPFPMPSMGMPPPPNSFMPFFSMGMPTFPPPPVAPIMPEQLAQMTEEQLRNLEGNERRAVEARIMCLRNIRTLLDAAMTHFHQYSSITANIDWSAYAAKETQSSSDKDKDNAPSTSSDAQTKGDEQLEGAVGYTPNVSGEPTAESSKNEEDTPENELRKRRIERFEKPQQSTEKKNSQDDNVK